VVGITQQNPKSVLAYSSVSQMGLLAAALGMGLAAGDSSAAFGTSFSATHHVLVKGGLFLAIGVAAIAGARSWPVLIPASVLALSLGGLPLTGGALAKLAVKAQFGDGIVGLLTALSAAGSTLLMLHFLGRLVQTGARDPEAPPPAGYIWSWLIMAFAGVVVPWALFPAAGNGSMSQALASGTLWAALWPVLIGGVLAGGLWRWGHRLPHVPQGDIVVVGETAMRATFAWGEAIERADGYLRQWPAASLSLLILVVILGALILGWG
jgi:formate hydrogenlyase subunit 3/multisubunit Na+/H+ antiporter MnhD subunit